MHSLTQGLVVKLAGWVLPMILGPLVYAVSRKLLNANLLIDGLPPALKRVVVALVGVCAAAALGALGLTAPIECTAQSSDCVTALTQPVVVQGVTAALVAMLCHALKKQRPAT